MGRGIISDKPNEVGPADPDVGTRPVGAVGDGRFDIHVGYARALQAERRTSVWLVILLFAQGMGQLAMMWYIASHLGHTVQFKWADDPPASTHFEQPTRPRTRV